MKKNLLPLLAILTVYVFPRPAQAATLQVGPGKPFATPCAAIAAAAAGDVILVDSSVTYVGDVCAWTTPNLTIRGVGGARAHIDAGGKNSQGKGIWVISGANTTIENIELSGATVVDQNGAGIRQQADNLTVRNCYFHDNEDGILTDSSLTSTVLIEFSEFAFNGFGDGQSHNVYISNVGTLIFRYNYSHHAKIGHLLKSRAAQNFILYNRFSDETTGTSSYQIDLPNGGLSYIIGNVIEQGPANDNSTLVAYLEEGANPGNPSTQMFVINNTFANDAASGTFISPALAAAPVVIKNNVFFGPGTITNQASAIKANNFSGNANFVNAAGYDYHLLAGSPAIGAGVDPGSDGAFSLVPAFQYVHPACAEGRVTSGVIDIGAYEFGGGTGIAPPNGTCSTTTGPLVSLSTSSLAFPAQLLNTASAPKSFSITNSGNASLSITSIVASGDYTETNNCATVAPGAGCTVNVTFKPTALGTRSGTVSITDNATGSPQTVGLSGTGTNTAPPPDFSVLAASGSSTVTAGQPATYNLTVAASGGFNQTVALSCSGAPAGSTCSVSPSTVNPNGSTATATVTVNTTARPASAFRVRGLPGQWPPVPFWVPALLGIAAILAIKRKRQRLALALPALAIFVFTLGCGSTSNNSVSSSTGGTPAGTYTLTVTGTAGAQSHSMTVTLVVK